jgi:hypothetical protein
MTTAVWLGWTGLAIVPEGARQGGKHESTRQLSRQRRRGELLQPAEKERIKRRIYPDRATASSDVFDYIERFTTQYADMVSLPIYHR